MIFSWRIQMRIEYWQDFRLPPPSSLHRFLRPHYLLKGELVAIPWHALFCAKPNCVRRETVPSALSPTGMSNQLEKSHNHAAAHRSRFFNA